MNGSTKKRVKIWSLLELLAACVVAVIVGCSSPAKYENLKLQSTTAEYPGIIVPPGSMGPRRVETAQGFQNGGDFSLLQPQQRAQGEELWILSRSMNASLSGKGLIAGPTTQPAGVAPATPSPAPAVGLLPMPAQVLQPETPGTGALMAKRRPDESIEQMSPCPLKRTDVKADVAGYIASVGVTQQFHNPFSEKIEAVYVFPLPSNAAVNEFVMTIGERHIRGIVRERQEAEKMYREARSQGYVASLLVEERPNIFVQSVANIEPGKSIDISIRYFNTMTYSDGWYEFAFPMVVGPRFNPPGSTEGIGAVGQGSRGVSGQRTEITYLKPTERSGHDISLAVNWDVGVGVERVQSVNHQIRMKQPTPNRVEVQLDPADSIPNKDFVLRCKVAGEGVKSGLIAQKDEQKGGYFTLMLVPPEGLRNLPRKPLEFVFTVDVSGSMSGRPIEQARSAMKYALGRMTPDDTFQVVRFDSNAAQVFPKPMPPTRDTINQANQYVQHMSAGGGTMMLEGMRKSLDFPHDESRLRFVAFLTDGYIGNEREVLGAMHRWLGDARVFSFGVGSSTNRFLLDHMAKMGNGQAAYLSLNDDAEKVMGDWFERISHPALTDIQIDWGGMKVKEVYPSKLPDLFVGRPVILTGRYEGAGPTTVKVRGRVGNETQSFEIPVNLDKRDENGKALPQVWARNKIGDLGDRSTYEGGRELAGEVRQVALEYGLLSNFTAFIAVDSLTRTKGDHGVSVPVGVPVPDGVRYETTVADKQGGAKSEQ